MIVHSVTLGTLNSRIVLAKGDHFIDVDIFSRILADAITLCSGVHKLITFDVSADSSSDLQYAFNQAVAIFSKNNNLPVILASEKRADLQCVNYDIKDSTLWLEIPLDLIATPAPVIPISSYQSTEAAGIIPIIYNNILASKEAVYQHTIEVIPMCFYENDLTNRLDCHLPNWRDHMSFKICHAHIEFEYSSSIDMPIYIPHPSYYEIYKPKLYATIFDTLKLNKSLNLVPYPIKEKPIICDKADCRTCSLFANSISGFYKQCSHCSHVGKTKIVTANDVVFYLPQNLIDSCNAIVSIRQPHPRARIKTLSFEKIVKYFVDFKAPQGFIDTISMPPCFRLPIEFKENEVTKTHPYSMAQLQLFIEKASSYDIMVYVQSNVDLMISYLENINKQTGLTIAVSSLKPLNTFLTTFPLMKDLNSPFSIRAELVSQEHLAFLRLLEHVKDVAPKTYIDRYNALRNYSDTQYNFSLLFITEMETSFDKINRDVILMFKEGDFDTKVAVVFSGWVDAGKNPNKILSMGLKFNLHHNDKISVLSQLKSNGYQWALQSILERDDYEDFFKTSSSGDSRMYTHYIEEIATDPSLSLKAALNCLKMVRKDDFSGERAFRILQSIKTPSRAMQIEYLRQLIIIGEINPKSKIWDAIPKLEDDLESLTETALMFCGEPWMIEKLQEIA